MECSDSPCPSLVAHRFCGGLSVKCSNLKENTPSFPPHPPKKNQTNNKPEIFRKRFHHICRGCRFLPLAVTMLLVRQDLTHSILSLSHMPRPGFFKTLHCFHLVCTSPALHVQPASLIINIFPFLFRSIKKQLIFFHPVDVLLEQMKLQEALRSSELIGFKASMPHEASSAHQQCL